MKKKAIVIAVVLLVLFAVGTVFAQSVSQINTWLSNAERNAKRAYTLASGKDAEKNIATISELVQSSVRELLKVENALEKNESLYDGNQWNSWKRKLNNIQADLNSVTRMLSLLL
ncbi:MAG: hypothetical protein LBG94_03170 [Treponema sp.]|jgi:predicted PurR-regulated permease PerM|nr:hypothetical protein [Treponema sp.]